MNKLVFILTLCLATVGANATVYLDETFNYTLGDINGQGSWTTAGTFIGGSTYSIVSPALSYSDPGGSYTLSETGKTLLDSIGTSASDYKAYKPFSGSPVSTGAIYLSFLFKATANITSTNQELFGLADGTSAGAKVLIGKISGSNFKVGTSRGGTASATDYFYAASPTSLIVGTTYFIVLKYDFSTLSSTVFINPTLGGLEAGATSELVCTGGLTARTKLSSIWVRQTGTVVTKSRVGAVRVSDTWAEAVAKYVSPATPLGTPDGVTTGTISNTGFSASWNAVSDALSYSIKTYHGTGLVSTTAVASGTSGSVTGLISGLTYTYTVTAIGDGTTWSNSSPSTPPLSVTTSGGSVSAISTDFSTGWTTVLSTTSGSFPAAYSENGFDFIAATVLENTKTGQRGETHVNYVTIDKNTYSGSITLPTVSSLAQIEIHAGTGTANRAFTLQEYNNGTWSTYGTYTTNAVTANIDEVFLINISRASATKLRIANAGGGGMYVYQVVTRSTTPTLLTYPTNGVAELVTATTAKLNWTAVDNASGGYKVYVYKTTTLQSGYPISVAGQTSNTLDVSSLTPNTTTYNYKVQAIGNGDVEFSDSYLSTASTNFTTLNTFNITGAVASSTLTTLDASSVVTVASGGHLTFYAVAAVGSITVASGAKVTLANTMTLAATNLTLQSDASGTGTFVDNNAAGGLTVSGTTQVNQYLASGRNWYMSSPVELASVSDINTATGSSIVSYDEIHGSAINPWITETTTLAIGKGYIVASPSISNPTITFTGTLNTDTTLIALTRTAGQTKEGFNLIGNPYPSYVNWEAATLSNVATTIWYRTRNTAETPAFVFDTYNGTTHAGTNNNLSGAVTGLIPPMQAVWAHVSDGFAAGSVTFNNSMRYHANPTIGEATVTTTPLKAPSRKQASSIKQQLLRLQVSNGMNSDEAIVVFNADASNSFDAFDSQKMSNNNAAIPEIYTLVGKEALVINGMNNPISEMQLGFRTGAMNRFKIKASELSNFDSDMRIILKDNVLNTQTDLTDGAEYSFSSDVTNATNRFTLLFKSAGTVTDMTTDKLANNYSVYVNADHQIIVANGNSKNVTVSIYDLMGQLMDRKTITGNSTQSSTKLLSGVYFVRVRNDQNLTSVSKVKVD